VQVVSNLLHNAAKFSDHGGVVSLSAEAAEGQLEITVEDHGTGIEPDLLPCMFDLFTQGDQTAARTEGGLGVGLALVRHIVVLHGGAVTAYSEGLGKGSRFVVRLPRIAGQTAAMAAA
jgi:two-component system, sensor histidine kinase